MATSAIVLVDNTQPDAALEGWKDAARQFAGFTDTTVEVLTGDQAALTMLSTSLLAQARQWTRQSIEAGAPPPPPMTSAEFLFRPDGRPDWAAMWTSFCDLALYGGPPHRGPGQALHLPEGNDFEPSDCDAVAEIRRGIFETTGLFSEPVEGGWLAVTCGDSRMAAWLCASIILENVDARSDAERLFVPAHPSFRLENEVKSVVTVVAKTHHYWQAHVEAYAAAR